MAVDKSSRLNISSNTSAGNYLPTLRQTFNNTQNWTVPTGVSGVVIVLAGGGGGGGSSGNTTNQGGAGGAGGGSGLQAVGVISGDTIAVTIGTGGNGGTGGSLQTGNAGNATTVGVGNLLYTANGGGGGGPGNNNNGSSASNTGNFVIAGKTVGTSGIQPVIPTNFVIDFNESADVFYSSSNTGPAWNTPARGRANTGIASPSGIARTGSSISTNLVQLTPYSGNNTNMVPYIASANIGSNGTYLAYSGQGGVSGEFDGNQWGGQSNTYGISPKDGISGLVGGGGGGSYLNSRPSGAGGGGHGGAGGDAAQGVNQRGGGGGGGLTGAGQTNTTSTGGNGGTGGGGGGGGTQAGAGGAGGAGAVLIYY
jgi:hypothetical protein